MALGRKRKEFPEAHHQKTCVQFLARSRNHWIACFSFFFPSALFRLRPDESLGSSRAGGETCALWCGKRPASFDRWRMASVPARMRWSTAFNCAGRALSLFPTIGRPAIDTRQSHCRPVDWTYNIGINSNNNTKAKKHTHTLWIKE